MLKVLNDKIAERAAIGTKIREMIEAGVTPEMQGNYDQAVADFAQLTKQIDDLRQVDAAGTEEPEPVLAQAAPAVSDFRRFLQGEPMNAVTTGTSSAGYLVPEDLYNQIVRKLYDWGEVMGMADVIRTNTLTDIPVDGTAPSAYWIEESGLYTDSNPTVSRVQLGAKKIGVLVKVSEELLQDSAFDVESYVSDLTAEAIGREIEDQFVAGTGSPISGLIANAAQALTTSTSTSFSYADVLTLYTSVKQAYARNGEFLCSRQALGTIMGLQDGANQYIFQPSYTAGEPDRLLGRPIRCSEAMPAAGAGKAPLLFGNFKYFKVGLRGGLYLQRLNERFADYGQVGFRAFMRIDGALALSEAVKKLVCKNS